MVTCSLPVAVDRNAGASVAAGLFRLAVASISDVTVDAAPRARPIEPSPKMAALLPARAGPARGVRRD
jgi:hypothetical protein